MADDSSTIHVCFYENCRMTFSKPSRLVTHMRSHTGERPYSCRYKGCNKLFKRSDHLRRHEAMSHCTKTEDDGHVSKLYLYRCEEEDCEAEFGSHDNLQKHIHKHHGQKTYKCHIAGCGAEFKKHQHLLIHRLEHSQETPYRCSEPECGKSFPFPNKLKRHMKTHEGYTCKVPECGVKFDKWSLLVKHNKVKHVSVHECPECEKSFSQKQWLKQHLLTHTASRLMYICPHDNCGREYLNQRNLNSHIRCYHDGKRFPCEQEECGQTFASKQKLQQHKKLHDPNRPLPKKKPKKKKSTAEKLLGVSMETEVRGQDSDHMLSSMNAAVEEDIILELPGLQDENSDLDNPMDSVTKLYFNTENGTEITVTENNDGVEIIVTENKDIINNSDVSKTIERKAGKTSKTKAGKNNNATVSKIESNGSETTEITENNDTELHDCNIKNVSPAIEGDYSDSSLSEYSTLGKIIDFDNYRPVSENSTENSHCGSKNDLQECNKTAVTVIENITNLNNINGAVINIAKKLLNYGSKLDCNSQGVDESEDVKTDIMESDCMVVITSDTSEHVDYTGSVTDSLESL